MEFARYSNIYNTLINMLMENPLLVLNLIQN